VFEDGLPRKSEYRRFSIKGDDGSDDVSAIREVITRRFRRYLEEREESGELDTLGDPEAREEDQEGQPERLVVTPQRKFAYPPNLVVVDGGAPQVAAAAAALADLGIDDVSVCGLAKRLEEVWLPGQAHPVIMSRTSEGLYLLQRVRDEAHRFAITYHRAKRGKAATASALDAVPGLGPARRAALLKAFGSVKALSSARAEEIAAVPGIGPKLAETVLAALHAVPGSTVLANTGLANTGLANTGLANTGLANTGLANTGLANTGLANTGLANTGLADTSRAAATGEQRDDD
jgi:excinuclease ABC subunit C